MSSGRARTQDHEIGSQAHYRNESHNKDIGIEYNIYLNLQNTLKILFSNLVFKGQRRE